MTKPSHAATVTLAACCCLMLAFLAGCGGESNQSIVAAVGSYGDVAIVLSDARYDPLLDAFREQLPVNHAFVLKTEPSYRFRTFSGKHWRDGRNYRNVILAVRWGDGGPVQGAVKRLLSKQTLARLTHGPGDVVIVHDPWFRRQLAVVAVSRDAGHLIDMLRTRAVALRDTLDADVDRRIVADNRDAGLLTGPAPQQWRRYGFALEVPVSYHENQYRPDGFDGIEWLQTGGATRGLTVSWRQLPSDRDPTAALADHDLLQRMRARLGEAMHQEELVEGSLRWSRTTVAGRPAVRLAGSWSDVKTKIGGPFWSYFLVSPRGGLYCFDLLVYAPDRDKMDDFRRLRAILETLSFPEPSS